MSATIIIALWYFYQIFVSKKMHSDPMYCLITPWKIVLNNHYVIITWWHGINEFSENHFINDWLLNVLQKLRHALNLHNVISHLVSFHYVVIKEFLL